MKYTFTTVGTINIENAEYNDLSKSGYNELRANIFHS
jgi:hypothetical protein